MGSDQFDFHRFLDYQSVHRCLYMSRYGKARGYGQIPYAMGWGWTGYARMIGLCLDRSLLLTSGQGNSGSVFIDLGHVVWVQVWSSMFLVGSEVICGG